ncbi:MAG: zinc ribbon domain-containing protein [Clostridiales bacterium]|nr:zinc ribbon domain-containing protein [Clostridiales bacterium]
MYCYNCGHLLSDANNFCINCGTKVANKDATSVANQNTQLSVSAGMMPSNSVAMKPLTCEMCGSNNIIKTEGLFTCQICGTKYSVEEARKMMLFGSVDVSGSTVKVDNSDSIKNFYMMAQNAYEAGNHSEAENYCNKIVEIDPTHFDAWFLKGKAAGWQSTLARIRVEESVQCFSKALDFAPSEKIDELKQTACSEIENLSIALLTLCCNNFVNTPTQHHADSIVTNSLNTQKYALQLIQKCGINSTIYTTKLARLLDKTISQA